MKNMQQCKKGKHGGSTVLEKDVGCGSWCQGSVWDLKHCPERVLLFVSDLWLLLLFFGSCCYLLAVVAVVVATFCFVLLLLLLFL